MKSVFRNFFSALILILVIFSCTKVPLDNSLPRGVPEAEGVSSESIITFLDSAATNKATEFHSFMYIRHGKVIAEGWWNPFSPELKHTLYSTSKSFTSTAVGLAIKEKKLHLDDKVISFFPDMLPDTVSPFLSEMEIKHLLSMSTGQRREPANTGAEWIKTFLASPVENEPGTKYRYSSMASYMLSAIVQKVTGEKVIDYLTPRLFEPLGITDADWETSPEGINTGGWGLRLKTEDLARLGLLYLHKGEWNGKQILPAKWVDEATSVKIYQNPNLTEAQRDSLNDSMQGYCYQFWRAKKNSYMANGAYGQFILVMPDKDAIVVLMAESQDMWGELDMVWKYLYPGINDNPLPANEKTVSELRNRLATLALPVPEKSLNEGKVAAISGKTIDFSENPRLIKNMTIRFEDNLCRLNISTDTSTYDLSFGTGEWFLNQTTMHGPNLFARTANNQNGLQPFKTAGAFAWKEDQSLELTLRYIDCMHTLRLVFHFDEKNKVTVDFLESNSPGRKTLVAEGLLR